MPLQPTWTDIVIRLLLAMLAGGLMGLNRGAHGHAAGLRTTILVTLAAAIAMVQMNLLLPVGGKQSDSFAVMDLMRLPLGILTGVGFLGGGAILKRGSTITGVTTAATLWIATVIGLCFGGGQLGLGALSTALGLLTLSTIHWIDVRIPRHQHGLLVVETPTMTPPDLDVLLRPLGLRARVRQQDFPAGRAETLFDIVWKQPDIRAPNLDFLDAIRRICTVKSFKLLSNDR